MTIGPLTKEIILCFEIQVNIECDTILCYAEHSSLENRLDSTQLNISFLRISECIAEWICAVSGGRVPILSPLVHKILGNPHCSWLSSPENTCIVSLHSNALWTLETFSILLSPHYHFQNDNSHSYPKSFFLPCSFLSSSFALPFTHFYLSVLDSPGPCTKIP